MLSTYQHDYVSPNTRRYQFMTEEQRAPEEGIKEKECECPGELVIEVPRGQHKKCEDQEPEWTGIAPMGRLIDARILPTKLTEEDIEGMAIDANVDCFKDQPNRFLKILRATFPDLYDRLKIMPKDELKRRMDNERMLTTYQTDFCSMREYPEGIYSSLAQDEKDETAKINARRPLTHQGPCEEFRDNIMKSLDAEEMEGYRAIADPCEKAYKPFKVSFTDSSRFISSGDNSHWRSNIFKKEPILTEYMDSISRNGCIIKRNNLHSHAKCGSHGEHCRHKIVNMCVDLK